MVRNLLSRKTWKQIRKWRCLICRFKKCQPAGPNYLTTYCKKCFCPYYLYNRN